MRLEDVACAAQSRLQIGVSPPRVEGTRGVCEEVTDEEDTRRGDGLVEVVELCR